MSTNLLLQAPPARFFDVAEMFADLTQRANIGSAVKTVLASAPLLSESTKRHVLLKMEAEQPNAYSFKVRGAFNKMFAMSAEERARGVTTASAGNHAQGVALAAKTLGIDATIVMPVTTPEVKVNAVRRLNHGVNIVLHGDAFPEALQKAHELQKKEGRTFVHPYDDPLVIAGQGTIAREIFEQHQQPVEAIFVPVGGGGLIAGIAAWAAVHHPETKVIGVEPEDSDCLYQAMAAGERVILPQVGLFADGVAVAQVGEKPFNVARRYVDHVIRVGYDQICAAAMEIFADTRVMPEPAGALAVAGLKAYAGNSGTDTRALVAIVSGANVDPDRIGHMTERAARGREMLLQITLSEEPGSLKVLCRRLGKHSITEFNYRHADDNQAHVLIGIRVAGAQDRENVFKHLRNSGYAVVDMTDNDLVREHIRHMVGGLPHRPIDETLYSFEFPEKPGALMGFLDAMPEGGDITLFHFRSHGAARGRVLMGLTAPPEQQKRLQDFAENSVYKGKNKTDNPAYAAFLRRDTNRAELTLA